MLSPKLMLEREQEIKFLKTIEGARQRIKLPPPIIRQDDDWTRHMQRHQLLVDQYNDLFYRPLPHQDRRTGRGFGADLTRFYAHHICADKANPNEIIVFEIVHKRFYCDPCVAFRRYQVRPDGLMDLTLEEAIFPIDDFGFLFARSGGFREPKCEWSYRNSKGVETTRGYRPLPDREEIMIYRKEMQYGAPISFCAIAIPKEPFMNFFRRMYHPFGVFAFLAFEKPHEDQTSKLLLLLAFLQYKKAIKELSINTQEVRKIWKRVIPRKEVLALKSLDENHHKDQIARNYEWIAPLFKCKQERIYSFSYEVKHAIETELPLYLWDDYLRCQFLDNLAKFIDLIVTFNEKYPNQPCTSYFE